MPKVRILPGSPLRARSTMDRAPGPEPGDWRFDPSRARQCARLAQPAEALRSKRRCSGFESPAAYQRGGIIQWQNSGPLNRPSWVRFPVPPPSAGVAQSVLPSLRKRKVVGLTPAASTTHRGGRNAGSSASQRGQETTRIAADLVELPRSEKSLSGLTLRSTSRPKEALLSTSTASSWSPPRPAPSAGLVVV